MGLQQNLVELLGLPEITQCPSCGHDVLLWFDDYDIECHRSPTGVFEIEEIECHDCGARFSVRCQLMVAVSSRLLE